jgi:putative MATE family efflux protein
MDRKEIFETMKVPKAAMTLALPTVLSMLVTIVYNMVDIYFVGQTDDPNQVAAVSLATPVFLLLMAVGHIFGLGGSSLISRRLGEGRKESIRYISSFCLYGVLAASAIMMAAFLTGMPFLLPLIGSSVNTEGFAGDYLQWIAYGAPFIMISFAFGNIVRSVGAARASMIGMMLGTVVNIILDPIMILSLGWGVTGAAIATVIGNIASTGYYLIYIVRREPLLSIRPRDFRAGDRIFTNVMAIGLPASLNSVLMSVSNIIINNYLAYYGDIEVAAMGVTMKANMLVFMVQLGIAVGVQPLIGYNFGARNLKRMKAVMRFSVLCTCCFGTVMSVLYYLFTKQIVGVFISDAGVIESGVPMLRAYMIAGPVIGIMFLFTSTFQAMGKGLPALILSVSRQGFVFLPVIILMNRIAGLNGVIYAQPISDYAAIIIALIMFFIIERKMKREEAAENAAPALPDLRPDGSNGSL